VCDLAVDPAAHVELPSGAAHGERGRVLDAFDALGDVAHGLGVGLAVFGREQPSELLQIALEDRLEAVHHLGALAQRQEAPVG
jgi:hypothetical protein